MTDADPLRVTAEDIESQVGRVTAPPVLTIRTEDVPEAPPARDTHRGHTLLITADDIAAFQPAGEEVVRPLEEMVFIMVNQARAEHVPKWLGRGPLQWHPQLARTARLHANDMLERRYVAHATPEGVTVANRLDRQGISYLACGENIGVIYGPASHGERGPQEVHAAFMNQPRRLTNHRGNILNPVWTHVGIGIAYAPEGQLIVTQNFIATLTKPV
ncbi:MAG: CAP domain-containing protein [Candidatus Promineofilum sp.]|nr:CAP domain-containing protein [Promineifilum sp.]